MVTPGVKFSNIHAYKAKARTDALDPARGRLAGTSLHRSTADTIRSM